MLHTAAIGVSLRGRQVHRATCNKRESANGGTHHFERQKKTIQYAGYTFGGMGGLYAVAGRLTFV